MKTRIFTFLVAFLATMSGAVWGQDYKATIDLSNPDNSTGDGYQYPVPTILVWETLPCFKKPSITSRLTPVASDITIAG